MLTIQIQSKKKNWFYCNFIAYTFLGFSNMRVTRVNLLCSAISSLLLCSLARNRTVCLTGTLALAMRVTSHWGSVAMCKVRRAYFAYWRHGLHKLHIFHIFCIFCFAYFTYCKHCILYWASIYFWHIFLHVFNIILHIVHIYLRIANSICIFWIYCACGRFNKSSSCAETRIQHLTNFWFENSKGEATKLASLQAAWRWSPSLP